MVRLITYKIPISWTYLCILGATHKACKYLLTSLVKKFFIPQWKPIWSGVSAH